VNKGLLFVYLGVLALVYVLALPVLFFLTCKAKHRHSIPARFWLWNNPSFSYQDVWLHACSLGEVNSLASLKARIAGKTSISAITQTGYKAACEVGDEGRFLPFEILLPWWVGKHKVLVVTEAELWLMLFAIAKQRGMKTVLMNARISDKSYQSYLRFRWLYQSIFAYVDVVFAQSDADKVRLESLGARNVCVLGNIKTASTPVVKVQYPKPARRVIILASTHEGEEERILRAFEKKPTDMLIVVPRHPERFKGVDVFLGGLAQQNQWTYRRFSEEGFGECDLFLCDTMGALVDMYALGDVSILGGSFVEGVGGHNPLEPAFFHNAVISGKHIFNQKALFSQVKGAHLVELDALSDLLEQPLVPAVFNPHDALAPVVALINQALENKK